MFVSEKSVWSAEYYDEECNLLWSEVFTMSQFWERGQDFYHNSERYIVLDYAVKDGVLKSVVTKAPEELPPFYLWPANWRELVPQYRGRKPW